MPKRVGRTAAPDVRQSGGLRFFTDREGLIAEFVQLLHEMPEDGFPVLVYHALSGQGKSTLVRRLASEYCRVLPDWQQIRGLPPQALTEEARARPGAPVPLAIVDFAETEARHPDRAILRLRRQLGRGDAEGHPTAGFPRLSFPRFDVSYGYWWNLTQPAKLSAENNFLPEETDTVIDLVAALTDWGLAGVPTRLLRIGKRLTEWWQRRSSREWVQRLSLLEPRLVLDLLPRAFGEDLDEQLAAAQPGQPDRCVLFLDTYEALWDDPHHRTQARRHVVDEWVRTLCSTVSRVLVVIVGRDRLRWQDVDGEWGDDHFMRQVALSAFSEADTRLLLARMSVADADGLHAFLHRLTGGNPLYLTLAADVAQTVRQREAREARPADFAGDDAVALEEWLLDRLLRWLPSDDHRVALEALSLPRWFDEPIVRALGEVQNFSGSRAMFEGLTRLHLVEPHPARPRAFTLHALVRTLLRKRVARDDARRCYQALAAHFAARLESAPPDDRLPVLIERIACLSRVDEAAAHALLTEHLEPAVAAWRLGDAEALLSAFEDPPGDPLVRSRWRLAWGRVLISEQKTADAIAACSEALAQLDDVLQADPNDVEAWRLRALALRREAGALWHEGRMEESAEACDRAVQSYDRVLDLGGEDVEAWGGRSNALWQRAGALYGQGRFEETAAAAAEAVASCDRALALSAEHADAWGNRATALQHQAWALRELARFEDSIAAADEAVRSLDRVIASGSTDTSGALGSRATALASKAESLRDLSRYQDAEAVAAQAVADFDRALAQTSGRDVTAWNNRSRALETRAWALRELGRPEEAVAAADEAVRSLDRALEMSDGRTAVAWSNRGRVLMITAETLQALERFAEAAEACDRSVESLDHALALTGGRDVAALANRGRALWIKAQALRSAGRLDAALRACDESVETLDRALALGGDQSPAVWNNRAHALRQRAEVFLARGSPDDAASASTTAAADCDHALDLTQRMHPAVWATHGSVLLTRAKALSAQGRTDDAVTSLEQAAASLSQSLRLSGGALSAAARHLREVQRMSRQLLSDDAPAALRERLLPLATDTQA